LTLEGICGHSKFKPPFKSTKEAKADVQNQDKVDKQKSETKSAPKKKTQDFSSFLSTQCR
jgi:hypothetical protein